MLKNLSIIHNPVAEIFARVFWFELDKTTLFNGDSQEG